MQCRRIAFTVCFGLTMLFTSSAAVAQYQLTNLVSNVKGDARHTDPLLINAWGLVYGPGGPFWISDEGSGWSTLYTSSGKAESLQVVVPSVTPSVPGSPTGIVFNGSQEFNVEGWPAIFLFATMDGTISGWAPQSDPTEAIIAVLCWIGAIALVRRLRADATTFNKAKTFSVLGLLLGFLLWQVGFMSIGGEWFGMWMSPKWNGVPDAFRFFVTILMVLIYLVLPDRADDP